MTRISEQVLATTIGKLSALSVSEKESLAEEIRDEQPHLLALSLLPSRFGVDPTSLEVLVNLLLVCYQAMTESGLRWPIIAESELDTQLTRWIGTVQFADWVGPNRDEAREQYLNQHPERHLLANVLQEISSWLVDRSRRGRAAEEDKFVIMASITLVNCIAFTQVLGPRG